MRLRWLHGTVVLFFIVSCATLPESEHPATRVTQSELAPRLTVSPGATTRSKPRWKVGSPPPKFFLSSQEEESVLVELSAFAVAYNRATGLAQWVSYCLTEEMTAVETVGRSDNFRIHSSLQNESHHPKWYTRSGYDRGHLAPAGDFRHSALAMEETFLMINIAPQVPRLNRGLWRALESRIRDLIEKSDFVCVITGPVLGPAPSMVKKGAAIPVPEAFFKAIYSRRGGENIGIGFLVPNQSELEDLESYHLPIRELEALVQINFFDELTQKLQDDIELDREPGFLLNPDTERR